MFNEQDLPELSGKNFKSPTRAKTCSLECKRQYKNKLWRERYHKLKEQNKC